MSGDYQHFIPQHVLKGFAIKGPDGGKCVWVFRKAAEPQLEPIKAFGGDEHFYSLQPENGAQSLDDNITKYENRLSGFIRKLRKLAPGPVTNPEIPAEIIAHLTFRTDAVRSGFTYASKLLLLRTMQVFSDKEHVSDILGLNSDKPTDSLRDHLTKLIEENPNLKQSGLPTPALERVLFGYLKENFPKFFADQRPMTNGALASLYAGMDQTMRDGHNKALEKDLAPAHRIETLSRMQWSIEAVSTPLVLPDYVAVGVDKKGDVAPYILQDADELESVAMPLTSNRLLIGRFSGAAEFPVFLFNLRAVASSENFFVASVVTDDLIEWGQYIGVEPRTRFHKGVSEAFTHFDQKKSPREVEPSEPVVEHLPAYSSPNWMMHFLDCGDEETAKKIGAVASGVVFELAKVIPLNRIDGITFARDYPAALQNLDRGFTVSKPLTTTTEEGVEGVAMAPHVLRDGVVKTHIVMRGDIGHGLISDDETWRNIASQMLVAELVEAACSEMFDTALPGVLLKPIASAFDFQRFDCVNFAWSSYISSRLSAHIARDSGAWFRDYLIRALDRASRDIPKMRYAYRFHGDVPQLMRETYDRLKPIL
ncbi:MAG: DUF4238 domain-containing protein, partial [Alphaproteobacteria bacterium]|nr:DUF4238 domain-containing protein [Alphaproteobacteria bacterium]